MRQLNNSRKANMVGFAIIGLAVLLLLGSVATDPDSVVSEGSSGSNSGGGSNSDSNGDYEIENFDIINERLFQLNSTILGKEEVEIQTYPNIKIGSAVEYEELKQEKEIILRQGAFNSNEFSLTLNRDILDNEDFMYLLVVVQSPKSSFDSSLGLFINQNLYSTYEKSSLFPVKIERSSFQKNQDNIITIKTPPVEWYELFSKSEQILNEIRVIGVFQDSRYSQRDIDFLINSDDEDNLNFLRMKLSVVCPQGEDGSNNIEAFVNNFKVLSQNPTCLSNSAGSTVLSAQIPTQILNLENDAKNTILLDTQGRYDTSLQIEEVYFNDNYEHSFYINRGSDVEDVIIFGDFDKESLDLKINSHRFTIQRRQTQSIKTKLRSGRNELVIYDRPIEIEDLIIEQISRVD